MATTTTTTTESGSIGWIIAFALLCYLFLQRECTHQNSVEPAQSADIQIDNFQEMAPKLNGQMVHLGPVYAYSCRPNDKVAWIGAKNAREYVLARCTGGFPGEGIAFSIEGVPTLKWINNENTWILDKATIATN